MKHLINTPSFLDVLSCFGGMAVLTIPALWIVRYYWPRLSQIQSLALSLSLGFSIQVIGLVWSSFLHFNVHWIFFLGFWGWGIQKLKKTASSIEKKLDSNEKWLLIIILLQFLLAFSTISSSIVPHGNDSVYHVAIADKFYQTRQLPDDFLPYDPVAPNVTPGSHWFNVWLSSVSQMPVHRTYQILMVFFLCHLSLLIFSIAQSWKNSQLGLFATISFVLFSYWGSWNLLDKGSLPNLMGMIFFLTAIFVILLPTKKENWPALGVFLAAIAHTHSLSAIIFGTSFMGMAFFLWRSKRLSKEFFRNFVRSTTLAVFISAPFLVYFFHQIITRILSGRPSVIAYEEGPKFLNLLEPSLNPLDWFLDLGPMLWVCFGYGLWNLTKDSSLKDLKSSQNTKILFYWFLSITMFYFILDWPIRFMFRVIWQKQLSILTPSQFLTDAVYFMCLFSGLAFLQIRKKMRPILVFILLLSTINVLLRIAPLWLPSIPRNELNALLWMRKNLPQNALILGNTKWTPYLAQREGQWMVMRQEELSPYTQQKIKLLEKGPPNIIPWVEKHKRPVYVFSKKPIPSAHLRIIWQYQDRVFIYLFLRQKVKMRA